MQSSKCTFSGLEKLQNFGGKNYKFVTFFFSSSNKKPTSVEVGFTIGSLFPK
jgi:hypothetical protein